MITELRISNVKRIKAFGIAPETGEPVILTGDNGAGKSSVLDAIFLALQNKGLEDPIRHGSNKATVKLTIHGEEGEYVVERTITKKTRSLKITGKDGNEIPSPQAFLDGLVGSLAFDPLEFVRMKPKAQAVAIRDLVGLDTSLLDAEYKETFARRTEVNRHVTQLESRLAAMPVVEVPEDTGEAEVSAGELIAHRDALQSDYSAASEAGITAKRALEQAHEANVKVDELRKALAAAEDAAATAKRRADQLADLAERMKATAPSPDDLARITAQIRDVDAVNADIRERRSAREKAQNAATVRQDAVDTLNKAKLNAAALTERLRNIDEKKAALLENAKMPVDGMSFDEDGVLIHGVRFDQLSTAEQVRVSAAVAMRGNPKLRLILVREGALLNKANLKAICDAAKEGDYQLFLERFQEEPGTVGLHIVDGSVSHIDGKPVAQELDLEGATA